MFWLILCCRKRRKTAAHCRNVWPDVQHVVHLQSDAVDALLLYLRHVPRQTVCHRGPVSPRPQQYVWSTALFLVWKYYLWSINNNALFIIFMFNFNWFYENIRMITMNNVWNVFFASSLLLLTHKIMIGVFDICVHTGCPKKRCD